MTAFFTAFLGMNVPAFVLMGWDKLTAKASVRRVPENILPLAALMGGRGGTFPEMKLFRHKMRHPRFSLRR
ncbi:MAG: hypothetical protein PWP47_1277 [Synergistaceae bacterium]|jgi:uncharacterized membrane protein YsdA (DUF1294 family)|nr:hypothetical protein [Synergistaceae bacterium]